MSAPVSAPTPAAATPVGGDSAAKRAKDKKKKKKKKEAKTSAAQPQAQSQAQAAPSSGSATASSRVQPQTQSTPAASSASGPSSEAKDILSALTSAGDKLAKCEIQANLVINAPKSTVMFSCLALRCYDMLYSVAVNNVAAPPHSGFGCCS